MGRWQGWTCASESQSLPLAPWTSLSASGTTKTSKFRRAPLQVFWLPTPKVLHCYRCSPGSIFSKNYKKIHPILQVLGVHIILVLWHLENCWTVMLFWPPLTIWSCKNKWNLKRRLPFANLSSENNLPTFRLNGCPDDNRSIQSKHRKLFSELKLVTDNLLFIYVKFSPCSCILISKISLL